MNKSDITALVSSRICHDLISPIGAISNGVELMSGQSSAATAELALIGDSVDSATTKLRYFRIAFGAVPAGSWITKAELVAAIDQMFSDRFQIDLEVPDAGASRLTSKTLLLCLLCQEKCLPTGGHTTATVTETAVSLRTTASKTRRMPDLWSFTNGYDPSASIAPGDVQFLLLGEILREYDLSLSKSVTDSSVDMTVTGLKP